MVGETDSWADWSVVVVVAVEVKLVVVLMAEVGDWREAELEQWVEMVEESVEEHWEKGAEHWVEEKEVEATKENWLGKELVVVVVVMLEVALLEQQEVIEVVGMK